MPHSVISGADAYALMMALDAPERAIHYRRKAERFRQMAGTEPNGDLRQSLLDIAQQYEDLANDLVPKQ